MLSVDRGLSRDLAEAHRVNRLTAGGVGALAEAHRGNRLATDRVLDHVAKMPARHSVAGQVKVDAGISGAFAEAHRANGLVASVNVALNGFSVIATSPHRPRSLFDFDGGLGVDRNYLSHRASGRQPILEVPRLEPIIGVRVQPHPGTPTMAERQLRAAIIRGASTCGAIIGLAVWLEFQLIYPSLFTKVNEYWAIPVGVAGWWLAWFYSSREQR